MQTETQIVWRKPVAGLTAKQAAQTDTYKRGRLEGHGVVACIMQARWSDALRASVLSTIRDSKRRSKAARKGWKTRRAQVQA